jgi:hypothetical protein
VAVGAHVIAAAHGDDPGAEVCMGCEHAVMAVAVDARRQDESGDGGQKLEGREAEHGPAVGGGARRAVADLALGGSVAGVVAGCRAGARRLAGSAVRLAVQALEGEGCRAQYLPCQSATPKAWSRAISAIPASRRSSRGR